MKYVCIMGKNVICLLNVTETKKERRRRKTCRIHLVAKSDWERSRWSCCVASDNDYGGRFITSDNARICILMSLYRTINAISLLSSGINSGKFVVRRHRALYIIVRQISA